MYEPCALIQDLLPLYRDGVCSDESRKAVEAHLKGCPACQAALAAMGAETPPPGEADERQKAASFESVRRPQGRTTRPAELIFSTMSYMLVTPPTCSLSLRPKKFRQVPQVRISTP